MEAEIQYGGEDCEDVTPGVRTGPEAGIHWSLRGEVHTLCAA
jgi:hypothetical protein